MPTPRTSTPSRPLRATDAAAALGTETAFAAAAAARRLEREGRDVVHLEIGEPGIPTPPHIVEAGERALRDGHTHYVSPAGIPELRDAIAGSLVERGVHTTAEHVIVTSGGKPGILYAALALIRPGDEVLIPDPGFPIYPSVVRLAGGTPVSYPVDLEASAGIDPAAIAERITPRTRVLVLNEPNNPTGGTASSATLDAIAELVRAHDLAVISDEVYGRLRFTGRPESIAARDGLLARTVLVDNFSKTYAMTGWRLGWVVVPTPLREPMERLFINRTSCTAPSYSSPAWPRSPGRSRWWTTSSRVCAAPATRWWRVCAPSMASRAPPRRVRSTRFPTSARWPAARGSTMWGSPRSSSSATVWRRWAARASARAAPAICACPTPRPRR